MSSLKSQLSKKLLQFQKTGLRDYGKYLDQQLKALKGKTGKDAYRKYIEQQIASTGKNVAGIDAKLKNL